MTETPLLPSWTTPGHTAAAHPTTCSHPKGADAEAGTRAPPGPEPARSFQYQHASWVRRLVAAGAVQSMSRRGNCYDNAVIENFFGHLKAESIHHARPDTIEALTSLIDDYIHWWNHDRVHTRTEGLSPVQYRAQALVA